MLYALPTESRNAIDTHLGNSSTIYSESPSFLQVCSNFWIWIQSTSISGNGRNKHLNTNYRTIPATCIDANILT